MFLQTYCNIQTTPSWELVRLKQTCPSGSVSGLELISMGYLFEGGPSENTQYNPTIYSPQLASGETIYAMVFKPHNFTLGVKYPTVLNVYGGPEVQTVSNTFKVSYSSRHSLEVSQLLFSPGHAPAADAHAGRPGLLRGVRGFAWLTPSGRPVRESHPLPDGNGRAGGSGRGAAQAGGPAGLHRYGAGGDSRVVVRYVSTTQLC